QGFLLSATLTLAIAALLADWAYLIARHVQWINFAAWLTVGTAVFAATALLWATGTALLGRARGRRGVILVLLLLATLGASILDALVHARDGWATMPEGLVVSAVTIVLALVATWWGCTR
ncbi:MAG: hypothetical protein RIS17_364, partial [Pseudomonadota bacterium]